MSDPTDDLDEPPAPRQFWWWLTGNPAHRRLAGLVVIIVVVVLAGLGAWDGPGKSVDIYAVRDGDTLEWTPRDCLLSRLGLACRPQPLRLYGVDAFEHAQTCRDITGAEWPCGAVATRRLAALAARPGFHCSVDNEFIDKRAREFAVCAVGGQDVGALLVSEGLAFYYGRGLQYLPIEAAARRDKRGAWAGSFVRPQFWRQGARS